MKKKNFKILTSWDDYCEENYRIAELLKKYKLPGIFFIDLRNPKQAEKQIKELATMGFEMGAHTINHPSDLKLLSDDLLMIEIKDCRKRLRKIVNQKVEWFCYPRGRYDFRVIDAVKEAGYKWARTTKVLNTDFPKNPFEVKTTIHLGYDRDEYFGTDWLEMALDSFDIAINKKNGYYHIWGHGWEIEKYNQWEKLEKLFNYLSGIYEGLYSK